MSAIQHEILRDHLTSAEKRFKQATGQDHITFGMQALVYYTEWLMLLAPEQSAEFLLSLIAAHGHFENERAYEDAKARVDRAISRLAFALTRPVAS